jgi:hypothetical protein
MAWLREFALQPLHHYRGHDPVQNPEGNREYDRKYVSRIKTLEYFEQPVCQKHHPHVRTLHTIGLTARINADLELGELRKRLHTKASLQDSLHVRQLGYCHAQPDDSRDRGGWGGGGYPIIND